MKKPNGCDQLNTLLLTGKVNEKQLTKIILVKITSETTNEKYKLQNKQKQAEIAKF